MKPRSLSLLALAGLVLALMPALPLHATQSSQRGDVTLGPKDGRDLPPADFDRVKVGDPAPDFTLNDIDEHPVSLSQFRGRENVLLVFYRGYW